MTSAINISTSHPQTWNTFLKNTRRSQGGGGRLRRDILIFCSVAFQWMLYFYCNYKYRSLRSHSMWLPGDRRRSPPGLELVFPSYSRTKWLYNVTVHYVLHNLHSNSYISVFICTGIGCILGFKVSWNNVSGSECSLIILWLCFSKRIVKDFFEE